MTQTALAAAAGVSRRFLADLEAGKSTVEFGLVLKVLDALGLEVSADTPRWPNGMDLSELVRDV